jgi:hypothetical protein
MDDLNIRQAHYFGHSMGGWIGPSGMIAGNFTAGLRIQSGTGGSQATPDITAVANAASAPRG